VYYYSRPVCIARLRASRKFASGSGTYTGRIPPKLEARWQSGGGSTNAKAHGDGCACDLQSNSTSPRLVREKPRQRPYCTYSANHEQTWSQPDLAAGFNSRFPF